MMIVAYKHLHAANFADFNLINVCQYESVGIFFSLIFIVGCLY